MSHSNQGQAVGTGARGGILISDGQGGTTEVFQSRPDQPSDPGRTRFIRGGGGGSGTSIAQAQAQAEAQRRAEEQARLQAEEQARAEEQRRQKAITEQKQFETTVRFRKKPTAREEELQMSIPEGQRLPTFEEIKRESAQIQPRPQAKGFGEKVTRKLTEFQGRAFTETGLKKETIKGQAKGFIAGAGLSAIGTVVFAKEFITHPFKTTTKTIKSIPKIPGQLKIVGPMIVQQPAFAGGFLATEILTAKGIGKGLSTVSPKKIVTKTPIRKVKTPQALEIKHTIITPTGKHQTLSSFKIVGEVSPPIRTVTTTKLRRLTGSAPISVKVSKPKGFFQETIAPVINQRPFMVRQVIEGKKGQTFLNVRGLSREVSVSQIAGTSKLEQFAFKKLVEQKTGRPMSITTATDVTPKTSRISFGEIVQEKSFISKPRKTKTGITFDIEPTKQGRGVSRQILVSRTSTMVDAPKFKTSFVETQFKDITFPFARATGKSPRLKQTIVSFKEPRIFESTKTKGFKRIKTTPSKPTQKQLMKFQTPLPKPAPPKTIGTKTTTQIIKTTIPGTPQISAVSTTLIGTPQKTTKSLTKTSTIQKPSATSIQKPALFVSQKPAIKLAQKPSIKLAQKPSIKLAQKPLTKLAQKPALKIAQKTTLKQMFKFTTTPTGIPKFPFASKPKDPFTPKPKSLEGKKKKKKKGGLFTVEVRRKGEFKTVGITGDISKAVSIGKGITASTLGATFRIKGAKKGSVGIPAGFRLPKASSKIAGPLTFIEKSKFRLSKAGEIGEIQRAKRIKTTRRKKKR